MANIPEDPLLCLGPPIILVRQPLVQGITGSHGMGLAVAEQFAGAIARDSAGIDDAAAA